MARNDWRGDLQSYANLLHSDDENIILPVQEDGATESPLHRRSGRDRAKAALRKRKGKATSSESTGLPQSFSQMTVASDRLAKAKLWKIYYRMKAMPTTGMSARDLKRHEKDLSRLREDLDIPDDEEDEEDDEEEGDEEGVVGEEEEEEDEDE